MSQAPSCSHCGTALDSGEPDGFCPACMLEGALQMGGVSAAQEPVREDTSTLPLLGNYQLLEEIARGGMGVVYKARQTNLDRIVAVKLILLGQFGDKAAVGRFKAEASAAAKLRHPNIVAIHEIGEENGRHFFSMEYIEGPNLEEYAHLDPPSIRRTTQLVKSIAQAVHYAHERGIIHRDLKPSNILIDCFATRHITDFGLAKDLKTDSHLTITGQVLGSPNYISPEQASGKTAGASSDIYSIGAVLYRLLTGRAPFAAETITETLKLLATEDPLPPRALNPSIPRDLETICLKCLEKSADARYASAAALAIDLERFLAGEPVFARKDLTVFTRTNWADPVFSRGYLERADRIIPERAYLLHVAASFFRHFVQQPHQLKVCDLGCGDGVLAEQLLLATQDLAVTLVDGSNEMLRAAKQRVGRFKTVELLSYTFKDLIEERAPIGPFHFIFSSFAIHHIPDHEKAALFLAIFQKLHPGGYFLNIDVAIPEVEALKSWYAELWREWIVELERGKSFEESVSDGPEKAQRDPVNRYTTLSVQLKALRGAGFEDTACHYRNGIFAIYSGKKPKQ